MGIGSRLRGTFRSPATAAVDDREDEPARSPRTLVDRSTQTFWAGGRAEVETLIEAEAISAPPLARVGDRLVVQHPRGGRPRANPAFSEALFVELMRAAQYRRAYDHLAPDCRSAWGDVEAFIAAQRSDTLGAVHGVSVKKVRYLNGWLDPESGSVHEDVAELEVEYGLGLHRGTERVMRRTIHLVAEAGQWRSVCYPPRLVRRAG